MPQTEGVGPTPAPTTFRGLKGTCEIIPGISQMQQGTSQPETHHIELGSWQPQSPKHVATLLPDVVPDMLQNQNTKSVEPICFYPCIFSRKLIMI